MGNNNSSSISSSSWSPRAWLGSSIPCLKPKREHKLLIHGLDSSGKTTLLYRLKMGEVVTTIPTIGFNVETLKFEGREFVAWDVGGRDKIRPLMRHYYPGTDGVIFMVDSNDEDRMQQARDEFYRLVTDELMENKPVLLLCNKQDLPNAWSPERVDAFFGVETANKTTRMVHVLGCVATKAENVWEGLEWLAMAIESDGAKDGEESDTEEEQLEEETEDLATVAHPEKRKRSHDPTAPANPTLKHFQPIKQGTMCPFAKAAKLWGGISQKHTLDAKELASSHAEALTKFVRCSDSQKLDGFCMELGDPRAQSADPEDVGACVKEMLTLLSDLDPAKEHVMSVNYVGSRGWRFRFDQMDFFVTTFAPCYSKTSSRYAFETGRAFILLQPESSFLRHELPVDTPHAYWEEPQTIRDKARVAFHKAGQPYFIPRTTNYPAAEHIVKPLKDDGIAVVQWWLDKTVSRQE